MGYNLLSISHKPRQTTIHTNTYTLHLHLERPLQLRQSNDVDTTQEAADTGHKSLQIGVTQWRQGLLPLVGETIMSHWTANARLSWAAPSQ